jgi:hypothetical protein
MRFWGWAGRSGCATRHSHVRTAVGPRRGSFDVLFGDRLGQRIEIAARMGDVATFRTGPPGDGPVVRSGRPPGAAGLVVVTPSVLARQIRNRRRATRPRDVVVEIASLRRHRAAWPAAHPVAGGDQVGHRPSGSVATRGQVQRDAGEGVNDEPSPHRSVSQRHLPGLRGRDEREPTDEQLEPALPLRVPGSRRPLDRGRAAWPQRHSSTGDHVTPTDPPVPATRREPRTPPRSGPPGQGSTEPSAARRTSPGPPSRR